MGWASRRNWMADPKNRGRLKQARGYVDRIREKVQTGEALSDADHRLLAKCGPKTLAYIGYSPKVTLA